MNLDRKKLLAFLYRIGAFWNPAYPNGLNVDQSSVEKLTLKHSIAKNAIATWQGFDGNFSEFTRLLHGRSVVPDGDVGPATIAMLDVKRCGIPDFAPPPTASFQYDDPQLQGAVASYQRYAEAGYVGGSGSWPRCDPQRQDCHSVVVAIDTSAASSHQKSLIADVLKDIELTEAEIGMAVRHVRDGSFTRPHQNVKFEYISGNVIGYAYFPEPDTCNQTVQARIDNSFDASRYVLAELGQHEWCGHSHGLEHISAQAGAPSIMNSSIGNPTSRSRWIGDRSHPIKKRYFGGVAIPNGPTEPPPDDPPTDPPDPPTPAPRITISGIGLDPAFGRVSGTFTATCGESVQAFKVASAGGRNFKLVEKPAATEPTKNRRGKK